MFELTCPGATPSGTCGDSTNQDFFADLGSEFTFSKAENPGFQLLNSTIGPYPGWLKGSGLDPFASVHTEPERDYPTFREQPDLIVQRTGRSAGYDERQEQRWWFLLGCHVLYSG